MKKIFYFISVVAISFGMISCGGNAKNEADNEETDSLEAVVEEVVDYETEEVGESTPDEEEVAEQTFVVEAGYLEHFPHRRVVLEYNPDGTAHVQLYNVSDDCSKETLDFEMDCAWESSTFKRGNGWVNYYSITAERTFDDYYFFVTEKYDYVWLGKDLIDTSNAMEHNNKEWAFKITKTYKK